MKQVILAILITVSMLSGDISAQLRTQILSLHEAVKQNDIEAVKQLLPSQSINSYDNDGFTCMHYAAQNKNREMIVLLKTYGAKTNMSLSGTFGAQAIYPLDIALAKISEPVELEEIIEPLKITFYQNELNQLVNMDRPEFLWHRVEKYLKNEGATNRSQVLDFHTVNFLFKDLKRDFDYNYKEPRTGLSFSHLSAKYSSQQATSFFVFSKGADPFTSNNDGFYVWQVFKNNGLNKESLEFSPNSILMHAIKTYNIDLATRALAKKADPNHFISNYRELGIMPTPLTQALSQPEKQALYDIVQMLIYRGADAICEGKSYEPPLFVAIKAGSFNMVNLLLNNNVSKVPANSVFRYPDNLSKYAIEIALEQNKERIVDLLLIAKAQVRKETFDLAEFLFARGDITASLHKKIIRSYRIYNVQEMLDECNRVDRTNPYKWFRERPGIFNYSNLVGLLDLSLDEPRYSIASDHLIRAIALSKYIAFYDPSEEEYIKQLIEIATIALEQRPAVDFFNRAVDYLRITPRPVYSIETLYDVVVELLKFITEVPQSLNEVKKISSNSVIKQLVLGDATMEYSNGLFYQAALFDDNRNIEKMLDLTRLMLLCNEPELLLVLNNDTKLMSFIFGFGSIKGIQLIQTDLMPMYNSANLKLFESASLGLENFNKINRLVVGRK